MFRVDLFSLSELDQPFRNWKKWIIVLELNSKTNKYAALSTTLPLNKVELDVEKEVIAVRSTFVTEVLFPIFVAVGVQSHSLIMNKIIEMSRLAMFHFSVQGGAW